MWQIQLFSSVKMAALQYQEGLVYMLHLNVYIFLLSVKKYLLFVNFLFNLSFYRNWTTHLIFLTWCRFHGHMTQQSDLLQSESNRWCNVHSSVISLMLFPWILVSIYCQHAVFQLRRIWTLMMMMNLVIFAVIVYILIGLKWVP